jgi:acyl dehydratase
MSGDGGGDMHARIKAGDRFERTFAPIDRVQLVRYAGASGDFNRIHFEEGFAREAGYRTVIAHGMLSMGLFGQLLAARFGPHRVRRLQSRFKAVTYEGEAVTVRAEVTAVDEAAGTAELRLVAETAPGTVTVEGRATVALA